MSLTNHDKIRRVEIADLAALKGVINSSGLFPGDLLDEMMAGYFSGDKPDEIWLTYEEESPVAVAYCAPEPMTEGTWNLYLIAVHKAFQGSGRGAAMMTYVEGLLKQRSQRILIVETSALPEFGRTRAFYHQIGYTEEARIRDFYQAGEDKVIFWKALL